MASQDQPIDQDETSFDEMIDVKVEQISLPEVIVDTKCEQSVCDKITDDDFTCELSATQRKESNISLETKNIQEGLRRKGRHPSTLPTLNKNAEKAREDRKRKREYEQSLEKELYLVRKENEEIGNVVKKQAADIILLKLQIKELQSLLEAHPIISKALKSFDENSNLENTAGTCLHVNLEKDSPESYILPQISRWNSEESLLDEVIETELDASCEPAADARRELITAETEVTPEGIQSSSKLLCPNEGAQKAREKRKKRKAYVEKLEKKLDHITKQNGHNSKVVEMLKADIMTSRAQVAYLESVLNNHARISGVLKSINRIPSEDNFQVESFDPKPDDTCELSAKRREESNISTETDDEHEGIQGRARLPTTLPATSYSAKMAREHRIRQKEYLQKLEEELVLAEKKKEEIINDINTYDIKRWRSRVMNLQIQFETNPSIRALLKLMNVNRSQTSGNTVGICLHVTRRGVSLELCAFCQGKNLKTEKSFRDEGIDAMSEASYEPAIKRKRVSSSVSRQEGARRRGRLPSTLPAPTPSAKVARKIRERKKQYLQTLEKELDLVRLKKEDIGNVFQRQNTDIMRMKTQLAYVEGVRDNQPDICALLKTIDDIQSNHDFFQCRKNTAGFCLHVNGNKVSLEFCACCHIKNFKP